MTTGEVAARRALGVRLVVVHLLAYVVAFPWAVAAVPAVFVWRETELVALDDERAAVVLVVRLALWPTLAAFAVAHLPGVPWIRAARDVSDRGRRLYVVTSVILFVVGAGLAALAWGHVLQR